MAGMIKYFFLFCIAFFLQLNASVIAFYNDYSINISSETALLSELKKSHKVYVAESVEQFDGLFRLHPEIDIAILALQDQPLTTKSFPNFVTYIRNGGKAIFSDGSRDASWESLFGFHYSGKTNREFITYPNKGFASLLDNTSQTLYNPGYHTYTMGLIPQETTLALFDNGDAASLLLNGKNIINGFLLDTDKPYAAAIARSATARASSSSILLAQVMVLNNPSIVATQQNTQPDTNTQFDTNNSSLSQAVAVPLYSAWYTLFVLMTLSLSVYFLSVRKA